MKAKTAHRPAALNPVAQELIQWTVPRLIGAGYGLFSRKAANPRWPEFIITAFVLRKYRGKNSFWFMIRHALKGMRKHEIVAGEAKVILARLIGSKPSQLYQLSGIYRALRDEKGPAVATAAIVEITRIANQKRMQKLHWWKRESAVQKPPKPVRGKSASKKALKKKPIQKHKTHR